MTPEFSIQNIKAQDVLSVCETIRALTDCKVEEFVLDSLDSGDLDKFISSLNASLYLAFRSILILKAEINQLKKESLQYKN